MIVKGSRVSIRGKNKTGIVLNIQNNFAQISIDSQSEWQPLDNLMDISDRLLNRLIQGDMDEPLKFMLAVDANRLMTKYKFDPYVLASSTKITIFPHQIDEVTWGIDNQRIMIADEVGLGKTIIAALVVNELNARGLADRALYVVPKPLVIKWQDELKTKFDTDTVVLDSAYFKTNKDPFKSERYDYVTSMDFLKQEKYSRLIHNVDMVVVDEVHRLRPGNDRYDLGKILSENTTFMIFLTATPHDGKDENFLGRMELLDPFVDDIQSAAHLWKRHVKEDVLDMDGKQVFPERTSETVNTELTNNERDIHRMLDEYIQNIAVTSKQNIGAVRFLAVILKKRAASSLYSLRKTLEGRHDKLGTVQDYRPPNNPDEDKDYEDQDNKYEYVWTGTDMYAEKKAITDIIQAIDNVNIDSKLDRLVEFIQNIKNNDAKAKILLFTEYRATLDYLEKRLGNMYKTGRIDGSMNMEVRWKMQNDFSKEDGPHILLCTDAAAEGVDMQFCNIEFNYDIPWNPNRLEQRMGRIHRIGQWRKVYYYNFVTDKDNTIDGMIHAMLFKKLENIRAALGDSVFDVLGRIIDDNMISTIYEELRNMPREEWEPKIMARLDEIESTRERVKQKIGGLLDGHRLDRTILEDIKKIRQRAIDSRDIERFLEVWTAHYNGVYKPRNGGVSIRMPAYMASRLGGELYGSLEVTTARKRNIDYIALGNRKVQRILEDAIKEDTIAALGHAKKSGLLCVYNRSVIDGDGHERNSETVAVFCNEDGVADMVDVRSIWDYEETQQPQRNTDLIVRLKDLADKKFQHDSKQFHDKTSEKLNKMFQKAKDAVGSSVATYVNAQTEKIQEWETKRHTSPRYAKMINDAKRKIQTKVQKGENRKKELTQRFSSQLRSKLVAIATVTPESDANARTGSDRAGMKIVLEMERERADTEEAKKQVKDVSNRDCGYDVDTADRAIEVKSFEGHPSPRLTSHEWQTAERFRDRYWLYVIENVHSSNYRVTEIPDPYQVLRSIIKKEPVTTDTFTFKWTDYQKMSGNTSR